jgi:ATP-dependent protease ClpP protease subunit
MTKVKVEQMNPFKTKGVHIRRKAYAMEMNDPENAEITMYGEVVESHPTHWYTGEPLEGDFIAQDTFLRDLDSLSNAKTITIRMNSVGGDSLVGMVIHNRLRELSAKGTHLICVVDGAAMSAASVIMSACDEVRVNPASLVMIHRCWGFLFGCYNANDLRQSAEMFDAYDRAAVSAYQRKTKISGEELLRMMSETTWLTGAEAVEKGFADSLIEDAEPLDIAASADGQSLFVRGKQIHLAPGMFAPDSIPTMNKPNQPESSGKQNGGTIMANLPQKQENPVPVNGTAEQQPNMADYIQAERQRLQEIDALAGLFDAETIHAAKYGEHPCTAQEMVYQAAQKAAQQGRQFLAALEADAKSSGTQAVSAAAPANTPEDGTLTPEQRMAKGRMDAKALHTPNSKEGN